jgi:hypothetical protein
MRNHSRPPYRECDLMLFLAPPREAYYLSLDVAAVAVSITGHTTSLSDGATTSGNKKNKPRSLSHSCLQRINQDERQ